MKKILAMLIMLGILVVACNQVIKEQPKVDTPDIVLAGSTEASQELKKFKSTEELRDFLILAASKQRSGYGGYSGGFRGEVMMEAMAVPSVSKQFASDSQTASTYSQTNVQVQGVDEADFVKNDNKYIYLLSGNKLVITAAFPAEDARILSETKIEGQARELFVNRDRLVVFSNNYEPVPYFAEFSFMPSQRSAQKTHVYTYDISDRSNPVLVKNYSVSGYYMQSRMIGDYVYAIVQDNVNFYQNILDTPVVKESSRTVIRPEIYYFDNPEYDYNFNTIASINIFGDDVEAKTFMMGYANTIYVSQDNIYITYQKNMPYRYYDAHNEERFYEVVVPLLPSNIRNSIMNIKNSDMNSYEKWDRISNILQDMYNSMDEKEKKEISLKIQTAIDEYEAKLEQERRKTVIHKIGIDDGRIDYKTKGEVPGYLLNQFSMDEQGDNFRVATTTNYYTMVSLDTASSGMPVRQGKNVMYNNVYVLDDELKIVGKLEKLAEDERIYSIRFMGDRLYMVTFQRIDPLFVIDLSNPANPEVLGELKIPGFSDYLHPYDENHIIGIGKDTGSNEWGGVSVKGLKLALFDVTNVKNPKEVDKYLIGEQGTDSEALHEHKAFLFDRQKNLLVIPVRQVQKRGYYDEGMRNWVPDKVWQGAYVFNLDMYGFVLKGTISHYNGDEDQGYYWGSPYAVKRSLFMDDVLYTVSSKMIKANSLTSIKDIKEVKLPESYDYYGGRVFIE